MCWLLAISISSARRRGLAGPQSFAGFPWLRGASVHREWLAGSRKPNKSDWVTGQVANPPANLVEPGERSGMMDVVRQANATKTLTSRRIGIPSTFADTRVPARDRRLPW